MIVSHFNQLHALELLIGPMISGSRTIAATQTGNGEAEGKTIRMIGMNNWVQCPISAQIWITPHHGTKIKIQMDPLKRGCIAHNLSPRHQRHI
jgi:hypothetical protein